jgi:hypothetical protein
MHPHSTACVDEVVSLPAYGDAMTTAIPIPTRDSTRRYRSIRLTGVVVLCALLVACGEDSSSSSGATTGASAQATATGSTASPTGGGTASPTGSEQLCADIDAFKSSIDDLKNVDIVKSGTSGLQTAVDKVKTSLQALRTSAASDAKDEIQAVEDSLKELETAIKNVSSGGEKAVVTAVAKVVSTGSALEQSLQDIDCS